MPNLKKSLRKSPIRHKIVRTMMNKHRSQTKMTSGPISVMKISTLTKIKNVTKWIYFIIFKSGSIQILRLTFVRFSANFHKIALI